MKDEVKNTAKTNKIYGLAYHSPLIIYWLISPIDYTPVLLINENQSDLKKTVDEALKFKRKPLVILAGSISILHTFLKKYGENKQSFKVILFDFPGLLIPFNIPHIEWLDCDCQSGGAWQITKFKTESFKELLILLPTITPSLVQSLLKITRYIPKERVTELEQVKKHLPETYKELLAVVAEETKKTKKEEAKKLLSKKNQNLTSLIKTYLSGVPKSQRRFVMKVILDYALSETKNKREYINSLEPLSKNESMKELLINLRIKIEEDRALFNTYLDYIFNFERRAWKTIIKEHELVDEQDLLLLLAYQPRSAEVSDMYKEHLEDMTRLPSDTLKVPYLKAKTLKLESLFDLEKEEENE